MVWGTLVNLLALKVSKAHISVVGNPSTTILYHIIRPTQNIFLKTLDILQKRQQGWQPKFWLPNFVLYQTAQIMSQYMIMNWADVVCTYASLVWVMACHLLGTKPLPEPLLMDCELCLTCESYFAYTAIWNKLQWSLTQNFSFKKKDSYAQCCPFCSSLNVLISMLTGFHRSYSNNAACQESNWIRSMPETISETCTRQATREWTASKKGWVGASGKSGPWNRQGFVIRLSLDGRIMVWRSPSVRPCVST